MSVLFASLAHTPSSLTENSLRDDGTSELRHHRLHQKCPSLIAFRNSQELSLFDAQLRQLLGDEVQRRYVRHTLLNTLRTHSPQRPLIFHFVSPRSLHPLTFSIAQQLARVLRAVSPGVIALNGTDTLSSLQHAFHSLVRSLLLVPPPFTHSISAICIKPVGNQ